MDQLSLFESGPYYEFPLDLLDYNGGFLAAAEADALFESLLNTVPWRQATRKMYGTVKATPRLTAWYGDDSKSRQLGGRNVAVQQWTGELWSLKEKTEHYSGHSFNSVLLNLYRDAGDSVAWHRDKESELGNRPVIASVSLGQVRNFDFRSLGDHRRRYSLPLAHGSLLIMKGDLQEHWEHRIAKSVLPMRPRINLTFRKIQEG